MNDRRCFVQFMHPGGEHQPDQDGLRTWNRNELHQRKFLTSPGRYVRGGQHGEGELWFWGEWEPDSRVVATFDNGPPGGPEFLYAPYLVKHDDEKWRQNTDPFVFGDHFLYTGCKQHTQRGVKQFPTQLRHLLPGSIVLFGSCLRQQFVLDTLFVVADSVDHSVDDWRLVLDGRISESYRAATIEPWYRGHIAGRDHRLYFGATPDSAVDGMFSFFPCQPARDGSRGFARPAITLDFVNPRNAQATKMAKDLDSAELGRLWTEVAGQVNDAGLALGVHAALPTHEPPGATAEAGPTPSGAEWSSKRC